jgi:hypothetical protein
MNTTIETQTANLNEHLQTAVRAHNWTSFSPEKRGEQMINEFNIELQNDIEFLKENNIQDEVILIYTQRFEKYFLSWVHAKSRCMSSMITGPARFPTNKAEKANRSEHNHYVVFTEWRKKAKKAIIRNAQPKKTINGELERYTRELDSCKKAQELMKTCNAIIRKAKGANCVNQLIEAGLKESHAIELQKPDWCGRMGFAQFNLTNNLAKIKALEFKVANFSQKVENIESKREDEMSFKGGKFVINHEADRYQFIHDSKPSQEIIGMFKKNGFKWSPRFTAWQRQITTNGYNASKIMIKYLNA